MPFGFGQSSGKKSIPLICWQVVTCLLIGHVMRYANKYGCMIILANAGLTETTDSVCVGGGIPGHVQQPMAA